MARRTHSVAGTHGSSEGGELGLVSLELALDAELDVGQGRSDVVHQQLQRM